MPTYATDYTQATSFPPNASLYRSAVPHEKRAVGVWPMED